MQFETGHLYHIYNQGNNRQKIFFSRKNYLFFIEKIKIHVIPFADILAWCLMPNHFHLMVYVNHISLPASQGATSSRASLPVNQGATLSRTLISQTTAGNDTSLSFNKSIGIMLFSYTRAINLQENRTGSLFRKATKAECLTKIEGITPAWFNVPGGVKINIENPAKSYPQVCFNYILLNPLEAGIVKNPGDWEYSSFRETINKGNYSGIKLINFERIREYGLEFSQDAT
jgi:putative transposase